MVAALLSMIITAEAQTRRIAHRFHSGADGRKYDGIESSYGIPSNKSHLPQSTIVLRPDTIHLEDGRDSVLYRWDTLGVVHPKVHEAKKRQVSELNQVGTICSTRTIR